MKAKRVVIESRNSQVPLKIESFKPKEPHENELLIKMEFAGVAYGDLMLRNVSLPGLPKPPFVPGVDAVGTVVQRGCAVQDFAPGDNVALLLMSDFGGQSQYLTVDQNLAVAIPEGIPQDKALCMMVNYLTALDLIKQFQGTFTGSTPRILVHGGSGGVGSALIQLARVKGMKVYSTASEQNTAFVEGLGARAINYRQEGFESVISADFPEGIDGVFDPIGGSYLKRSLAVLKPGGCYIGYGFQEALERGFWGILSSLSSYFIRKLFTPGKNLVSSQLTRHSGDTLKSYLGELFQLYIEGAIDPEISQVFPLEEAEDAYSKLQEGNRRGKILLAYA